MPYFFAPSEADPRSSAAGHSRLLRLVPTAERFGAINISETIHFFYPTSKFSWNATARTARAVYAAERHQSIGHSIARRTFDGGPDSRDPGPRARSGYHPAGQPEPTARSTWIEDAISDPIQDRIAGRIAAHPTSAAWTRPSA
jgi:hypothetical protein